jgi:uncharacterized membrane protein YhaH (DUF805 family)
VKKMALGEMYTGNWGALIAVIAGMIFVIIICAIVLYLYLSFAFMAIAKKAKLKSPGLAWIPYVGPAIIAYKTSKMHWWPWLLIIGMFIPFVKSIFIIVFAIFALTWEWKMFEKIKKPGWWALLCLIPIVNLVLWGVAAWSKK